MNNDIPNYIITLTNAIIDKRHIIIFISKYEGDKIKSVDYLINFMNIAMNYKLIFINVKKNNINFIYRYYTTIFQINVEYNQMKQIYKISCEIK